MNQINLFVLTVRNNSDLPNIQAIFDALHVVIKGAESQEKLCPEQGRLMSTVVQAHHGEMERAIFIKSLD